MQIIKSKKNYCNDYIIWLLKTNVFDLRFRKTTSYTLCLFLVLIHDGSYSFEITPIVQQASRPPAFPVSELPEIRHNHMLRAT